MKKLVLTSAMAAFAMLAQAAITTRAPTENASILTATVTDIETATPTISGQFSEISGYLDGYAQMAAGAEYTLTYTAATNWSSEIAQTHITDGTFTNYISGLTSVGLGRLATTGTMGVIDNQISAGEVIFIELGTTNISQSLFFEGLTWGNSGKNDRADILIYDASSNTVTEIRWDGVPHTPLPGSYAMDAGDMIVIAAGATIGDNWFRKDAITFNVPFVETGVSVPLGLVATLGTGEIQLDWADEPSGAFDSYNVYRSLESGTNFTLYADGLTNSAYADTHVVNDFTFYYKVTTVDTNAFETDFSDEVSATPTANLIVENLNTALQGTLRAATNGTGYASTGSNRFLNSIRVGQYSTNTPYLGRSVLKFELEEQDIVDAGKTTNDIERAWLRVFVGSTVALTNAPLPGSAVEVYASHTEAIDSSIVNADFEDAGFDNYQGAIPGIVSGAATEQYYEIDVTDAVLADLANDRAGSAFRLQLNDDLSLTNPAYYASIGITNYAIRTVYFDDNAHANPPRLKVEFTDGRPLYVQWSDQWFPEDVSDQGADADDDGLNNLQEYGLDGDPTDGTQDSATLPVFSNVGGSFTYVHPMRSDDDSLTYTVETKTDLTEGSWTNIGYTIEGTNVVYGTLDFVTNSIDAVAEDQRFIRLKIED
ncbi:fibronectin type III domain-containing protein [Pontiella desulfatans]|nr:hypothetical protein [Pontiella desulfatans]